MTKRRSRGDGGLHWDENRQRWIASITVGYTPAGKRITKKAAGHTKTEAKAKLTELLRQSETRNLNSGGSWTVAMAVRDFLTYGLAGRDPATVTKLRIFAEKHVIPQLGASQLQKLTAEEVDRWLAERANELSTESLQRVRSILNRSVKRAQARDKVSRNVVLLCECPTGRSGRPSKSLTFEQANALLGAAEVDDSTAGAYIAVCLLTGARTEEARPLTWDAIERTGTPHTDPPVPPHMHVWRSVRTSGDTKTRKSRRTLALPQRAVDALDRQHERQRHQRAVAGSRWHDAGLVFASEVGTELDAHNVRRSFRRVARIAGLTPQDWTPRELRHSFVSLLSESGLPIEKIALLVGHSGTHVTEKVYRHQLRPVLQDGAVVMDQIFGLPDGEA